MCGILVYKETKGNNSFIGKRGRDVFTFEKNGVHFVHTLLPINGYNPQPFVDGEIVCLYNGEIYNHKFDKSDGENIIPLYKKYGVNFPKYLDGEFAIAITFLNTENAIAQITLFN